MNEQSLTALSVNQLKIQKEVKIKPQPLYTKGEEIFNYVSHIVGGAFGLFALAFGIVALLPQPTGYKLTAMIIYALSITVLYTMSALYHALPTGRAKRVFRVFDHCTIFLLIAGTYTPYCLIAFNGETVGTALFILQWTIAAVGITFNAINMEWKAVKILSMLSYIIMGWCIIFTLPLLLKSISTLSFIFLLTGGVAYTVGIVFYALGKKKKYFHSIWHLFDIVGTVLQFISIILIL